MSTFQLMVSRMEPQFYSKAFLPLKFVRKFLAPPPPLPEKGDRFTVEASQFGSCLHLVRLMEEHLSFLGLKIGSPNIPISNFLD
jgi:hypothetical protein